MPHFFAKLIAPRPPVAMDMDAHERAMTAGHFAYWKSRLAGEADVFKPDARSQGILRRRRDRGPEEADPIAGLLATFIRCARVTRAATTSA
jgi:hypothetical protein